MATRHGKIISKSFPSTMKGTLMENQQVLIGRRIGSVLKYLPQTQMYQVKFLDNQTPYENYYRFDQLFGLVVQYRVQLAEPIRQGNVSTTARLDTIPLKWSQWHQAINHKEVDNQKSIKFEDKNLLTTKGEVRIAKVIPTRQRSFSGDDVSVIMDIVWALGQQFGLEADITEAQNAFADLKAEYVD